MRKQLLYAALLCIAPRLHAQDTLALKDLPVAAKTLDIQFTGAEIDSMYDGVKENLDVIRQMHHLQLPNAVPMSLWQQPQTQALPTVATAPNAWVIPNNIALPANRDELAYYSILQLASLIKHRKISSAELTQFFISRIKKYSDTLHCLVSLTEEIAMRQAKQADAEIAAGHYRGPLHGIPYGLKDLFAVRGTRTTWGAAPYKDQEIDEDAFVYTQLKKAGAVLVAKLSMGALAMGDQWFGGKTRNPWNLQYGSSGSSAGSASATVAGLVPFAIGTETWGSIISPSTVCGATGLRPSFGTVSRSGAMTLSWSLDKTGPICRSAADAAIVYDYIRGTDGKDLCATARPFRYPSGIPVQKMRVGYARNYFDKIKDTSRPEWKVLQVFRQQGIQPEPVDFPDSGVYRFPVMSIVIGAECAAAFDDMTRSGLDDELTYQTKLDWPNSFRTSRFIPAVDYINANRHRYLLMQQVDAVLSRYDMLICPTWSGNQNAITNLTGHPAICFPIGFNSRHMPSSITLVGKLYGEATLLELAKLYQDATGWNKMHPPLFSK